MLLSLAFLCWVTGAQGSPPPPPAQPGNWEGRVLDAFTAQPLAGVHCEAWTENMWGPPLLMAECWSAEDGTFVMSAGTKLVLRRAGYRSTELGSPEEEIRLFPAREPFELTLLDLDGLPIAGATVRVRQSCRHAVPAVEALSGGDGSVRIPDFPPFQDGGELEVLASGFGGLAKLGARQAWQLSELYLPRRPALRVRWLDPDGAPIPAGRLRYDTQVGEYPLEPDPEGWVSLDRLFGDRDGVVFWRHQEPWQPGRQFRTMAELAELPSRGSWTVRLGTPPENGSELALVLLEQPAPVGPAQKAPDVHLLHEQGWLYYGAGEHRMPAGKLHLIVGRPFSGVCERIVPLEVRAGETLAVPIVAEPEPELRILLPDDADWIHVQADDDSITLGAGLAQDGVLVTHVPPAARVTVLAQGRCTWRAVLEGVEGDRNVDLRAESARLPASGACEARAVELRFLVRAEDGSALEARASVRAAGDELDDTDPAPERVCWSLPAGTRFEARFAAEGFRTLYRSGIAGERTSEVEELRLPRAR